MASTTNFVRPSKLLVPETVKLSPVDQFTVRCYTPSVLIFRIRAGSELNDVVFAELSSGLALLLEEMPVLAGKVVVEDASRQTIQVDIAKDSGVNFKRRDFLAGNHEHGLDFDELEKAWFPSSALDPALLSPCNFVPDGEAPCFVPQANFIPGGLILVMYIHHGVVDGFGSAGICTQWARHVTAFSSLRIVPSSEQWDDGAFDRTPLSLGPDSRQKVSDFPGFEVTRKPDRTAEWWEEKAKADEQLKLSSATPVPQPLTITYWYISKESLSDLQDYATPEAGSMRRPSASNVLAAFIWRQYSRARGLDKSGVKEVNFFMPVDIRSRIEPPLHPNYLGNAVVHSQASISVADLFSTKPDALWSIANRIADAVEWWTSDRIWGHISAMESAPRVSDFERGVDISPQTDFTISDTSSLPLFKSYWGANLGEVSAGRFPGIFMLDGQASIFPRLADGGLPIITFMKADALANLRADEEFIRFIQFKCT